MLLQLLKKDWDISDNVEVWSPDYQDPSTYLEIIKPGENTKTFLGFDGKENAAAEPSWFEGYAKLVDEAAAEKETDVNKR